MAFKCGTATWKSWLNPPAADPLPDPPTDGHIDTDVIFTADGDFLGFHRLNGSLRPILGKCADMPDHRIKITKFDGTDHHLYFGKITVVNGRDWVVRGNGRHRQSNSMLSNLTEADWDFTNASADDEWVAEKIT